MKNQTLTIVTGPFAIVSAGNGASKYMLDGDDIQVRADASMDRRCGVASVVRERGLDGFGVQFDFHGECYILEVYADRDSAERLLAGAS